MKKDKLKGGKSDTLSIESIAKKHDVSIDSIKEQINIGKKIELEHVDDEDLAVEIAMDHLEEIPDYYTRLIKMEKDAKQNLNEEARKMMALAGIQESDKKFLSNESFSEPDSATLYPDGWKEMDGMFMGGPNRITQEKLDAVKKMMENENQPLSKNDANPEDWKGMDSMNMGATFQNPIKKFDSPQPELEESVEDTDANFIVSEFDQIDVEPGEDDDKLYKLG